jgi:hypothetical protein
MTQAKKQPATKRGRIQRLRYEETSLRALGARWNTVKEAARGRLISSKLPDGKHAPAIDIDFPVRLVKSSTPGHFHLYVDKAMSWEQYRKILLALRDAGVIGQDYYEMALTFKQTFLRAPGVHKRDLKLSSGEGSCASPY